MPKKKYIELHQHEINSFLQCKQKFDLMVNKRLRSRVSSKPFKIGGLFAKGAEMIHNGIQIEIVSAFIDEQESKSKIYCKSQEEFNEIETDKIIVTSMLYGYFENFDIKGIIPEYQICIPINDYKIICRLDGRKKNNNKDWILELKTSSQIEKNLFDKLPVDFQIKAYYWALQKWSRKFPEGIIYRYIKKPSIRQRKNERLDQFQKRLLLEYLNEKEKYFYEQRIYFDKLIYEDFEKEIVDILNDISNCYKTNKWYKSGFGCTIYNNCQYLKYCSNPTQETLETFYEQKGA